MMPGPPLTLFVPHCSSLLTDYQPHGDGLVAYGFLKRLAARGHTLHVVAEAVDLREPAPENLHITVIPRGPQAGLAYRQKYLLECRAIYKKLSQQTSFDVIHQLNPVFTGVSLALTGAKEPLVLGPYVATWPDDPDAISAGGAIPRKLLHSLKSGLARLQQQQASAILLTTPAAADRLVRPETLPAAQIILPHGLDTDFFSPGPDRPSPHQDVLFLSNLLARKGILDLITAFQLVAAKYSTACLIVAGEGPELNAATALAQSHPSRDRVVFLGRQTRDQSLALLRQCTVFCQPSHGEPYGMSVAEAMSCAKPVIATRENGLGFLIDDDGGLRVPMRQPQQLAGAIDTLLGNPALRQSMGVHNRLRAVTTMSWDRVIDRLEDVYRQAIETNTGGRP